MNFFVVKIESHALVSIGTRDLVSIRHDRPAIEAFKTLNKKALTAMPVVDDDGKMVRDLR